MARVTNPFPHLNAADQDGGRAWRAAESGDDLGMTGLHTAVLAGDVDAVVSQLMDGTRAEFINRPMRYGFTALHLAAKAYSNAAQGFGTAITVERWSTIIGLLLADRADPTARDWKNRIPLALAEGFAPRGLRNATELAALSGAFYTPEDGYGPPQFWARRRPSQSGAGAAA